MVHRTRWQKPAFVAGTLGVMSGTVALAAEPTQQQLVEQIQTLQQEVRELKQNQQQMATTNASSVNSVLNDAELRSTPTLQASSSDFVAGYKGGKFLIQSADGKFSLNPNLQLQVRNVTNYRENASADGGERTENGFEIRRAKFAFAGNVFSKNLTYNFQFAANRAGGAALIEDAWLRYMLPAGGAGDGFGFRLGQFKDITFHEETNSSKRQLAVDRSLTNELLGGGQTDFIQGATVIYDKGGAFRAEFGVTDGFNSDNANFQEGGGGSNGQSAAGYDIDVDNANWGFVGRAELVLLGKDSSETPYRSAWKQYDDFTAMNSKENSLVLGAGGHFTNAGDINAIFHTVDVQFENNRGLSVYAGYYGLYRDFGSDFDTNPATAVTLIEEGTYYDYGFVAQVGYMLTERLEPFARYSLTQLDDADASIPDQDSYSEITVGANYYLRGHAAKFTIDANYLPEGVPAAQSGIGYLGGVDEAQISVRAQFQLLI